MNEITARIEGIKYNVLMDKKLKIIKFINFDINQAPSTFKLEVGQNSYGISKWVSPKRTRSYPYARVYDTLQFSKRITVIPIIKDEGIDGDRDFIQWDTISLMSLLDTFVILCYYDKANKNPKYNNKIYKQRLDNKLVKQKIEEINSFKSSALHWNLQEIKTNFFSLIDSAIKAYCNISQKTGVKLHDEDGLINVQNEFIKNSNSFIEFSRAKAKNAQARELATLQKTEWLSTASKSPIIIKNYLGGEYNFTVDEISLIDNVLYLIESKHTQRKLMPNLSDIKDGLIKMILYSNLVDVKLDNIEFKNKALLRLTSEKLIGYISNENLQNIENFFKINNFKKSNRDFLLKLFNEGIKNNFLIELKSANNN
jgi:hypothetical protein